MIQALVSRKHVQIVQNMNYEGQIADEMLIILDRLIIDGYIKLSPRQMELSDEEKRQAILKKRREILAKMAEADVRELEYVYSDEDTVYHYPCETCELPAKTGSCERCPHSTFG